MTSLCFFKDCSNPVDGPSAWKCHAHKHRSRCLVELCSNQMYARNLCIRHGGKRTCAMANCDRNVRVGGYCVNHGASLNKELRCNEANCSNVARKQRKCVRHGGGKQCQVDGCKTHARKAGFCCRHAKIDAQTNEVEALNVVDLDLSDLFEDVSWLGHTGLKVMPSDGDVDSLVVHGYLEDLASFVFDV
ncbi:Aste57867_11496 [Aphanomyces stellatus]|uniref:Aste57867_11496 protein n=1 Tax=Aphanomyces stellatus TaxID=120398 RepID=A0A485KTQ8_9STRA|nr:hypothetical protein As57867_011453 [Aphanomyces stellatus]VFT88357.1 Aste57867_11496 [Aphanomyces stellatus]